MSIVAACNFVSRAPGVMCNWHLLISFGARSQLPAWLSLERHELHEMTIAQLLQEHGELGHGLCDLHIRQVALEEDGAL